MFEHYLPNKNESATVAQNPKFPQLNTEEGIERMLQ